MTAGDFQGYTTVPKISSALLQELRKTNKNTTKTHIETKSK